MFYLSEHNMINQHFAIKEFKIKMFEIQPRRLNYLLIILEPDNLREWVSSVRDAGQGNGLSFANRLTLDVTLNFWRTRRN
jgi:hypothetical protein